MGFEKIVKIAHSRGGKTPFEAHFKGLFQVNYLKNCVNCSLQGTGCHNKIEV